MPVGCVDVYWTVVLVCRPVASSVRRMVQVPAGSFERAVTTKETLPAASVLYLPPLPGWPSPRVMLSVAVPLRVKPEPV